MREWLVDLAYVDVDGGHVRAEYRYVVPAVAEHLAVQGAVALAHEAHRVGNPVDGTFRMERAVPLPRIGELVAVAYAEGADGVGCLFEPRAFLFVRGFVNAVDATAGVILEGPDGEMLSAQPGSGPGGECWPEDPEGFWRD